MKNWNWGYFIVGWYFMSVNRYYGWRWDPKSDAELICDGIVCLLWAIAYLGRKK